MFKSFAVALFVFAAGLFGLQNTSTNSGYGLQTHDNKTPLFQLFGAGEPGDNVQPFMQPGVSWAGFNPFNNPHTKFSAFDVLAQET